MIYECCPSSSVLSHLEIPKSIKKIITSFTELERGTEDIGVVNRTAGRVVCVAASRM